ncbi:MAG: Wzy polymerase domain-containing protein [Polaromonas sp.]
MLISIVNCFGVLLFALAWLSFDHYRPWVNFHAEAMAIVGIGLLLLGRFFAARNTTFLLPKGALWVAAVTFIPWLQCIFSADLFAGDALVLSFYFLSFTGAICLGCAYVGDQSNKSQGLMASFYTLWFVALVSAGIGLLQWFGLQEPLGMYVVQTDFGDRAMGNLGQPNQLATLLLMGIAALLWTFEQGRIGRIGTALGVCFLSLVLLLTQSRAGMLSSIAGVLFLTWKYRQFPTRLKRAWLWVWLLVFLLCVQALPYVRDFLYLGETRHMNPLVDGARQLMWKQVISGVGQAPWFGYGWNQMPAAHAAGGLFYPGSLTFSNAHNVVLDMLAWNGIPLGLLLVTLCTYWLFSRMKLARAQAAVYGLLIILPIAVHSMVEYPFAYAYFLLAAGLMAGIVEGSHTLARPIKLKITRMTSGCLLAIPFLVGGFLVYEYLLVEEDFQVVRFENLRVGQTPTAYEVPRIHLLTQMSSMLKAARQEALPEMTDDELGNLRKASSRFAFGSLRLRYALALGLNGNPVEATKQFAIIRGMYGNYYYQAAVSVLRQQQQEKYPVLSQVITP